MEKDERFNLTEEDVKYIFTGFDKDIIEDALNQLNPCIDLYIDLYGFNSPKKEFNKRDYINSLRSNLIENVRLMEELEGSAFDYTDYPYLLDHENFLINLDIFQQLGYQIPTNDILYKPFPEIICIVNELLENENPHVFINLEQEILNVYEDSEIYYKLTGNKTITSSLIEKNGFTREHGETVYRAHLYSNKIKTKKMFH